MSILIRKSCENYEKIRKIIIRKLCEKYEKITKIFKKMKKEKIVEIIWLVVIICLFILSIKLVRSGELQSEIASFGIWAPLVLILLKMSTLIIAPLGGVPLYILAGTLFGGFYGFFLCFLGDVLGSTACFFIGRKYGEKVVKFFVGKTFFEKIEKFASLIDNTKSFMKARIAAFNIPEILAYAAGLSRINFWKFLILHMPLYLVIDIPLVFFGSRIAHLSKSYVFITYVFVTLISGAGIFLLWKDYQKTEGM